MLVAEMLTLTSLAIWLHWEQSVSVGSGFAGSGGILTVTFLKIWLHWEQAGSGGSGFAGRGETAFPVSKPIAVGWALLVGCCNIKFYEE
jgi:hypothetical protein